MEGSGGDAGSLGAWQPVDNWGGAPVQQPADHQADWDRSWVNLSFIVDFGLWTPVSSVAEPLKPNHFAGGWDGAAYISNDFAIQPVTLILWHMGTSFLSVDKIHSLKRRYFFTGMYNVYVLLVNNTFCCAKSIENCRGCWSWSIQYGSGSSIFAQSGSVSTKSLNPDPMRIRIHNWIFEVKKERGFFSTYYTYITVFIRNTANLTVLLLRGLKLRKGNKN
jgi:hypothetical protein